MGHIRYINILTWLWGFRVKIVNFLSCFCLLIPRTDFDTKKAIPNIDACPESLRAMLEYWYMERGLLGTNNLPWSKHQELTWVQAIIELEAIACMAGGFGGVFQWAFVAQNRQKNRNCQLNRLSMVAMAMTLCTRLNDLGHLVTLIFLVVRDLTFSSNSLHFKNTYRTWMLKAKLFLFFYVWSMLFYSWVCSACKCLFPS